MAIIAQAFQLISNSLTVGTGIVQMAAHVTNTGVTITRVMDNTATKYGDLIELVVDNNINTTIKGLDI